MLSCFSFAYHNDLDQDKSGLRCVFQVRTRRNLEDRGCRLMLSDDEFDPDCFIWIPEFIEEYNTIWGFCILRGEQTRRRPNNEADLSQLATTWQDVIVEGSD